MEIHTYKNICVQVNRHYCRRCLRVHRVTLVWFFGFGSLQFLLHGMAHSWFSFVFFLILVYLLTCRWSNWSHFISQNAACVGVGSKHTHITHLTQTVRSFFFLFLFILSSSTLSLGSDRTFNAFYHSWLKIVNFFCQCHTYFTFEATNQRHTSNDDLTVGEREKNLTQRD